MFAKQQEADISQTHMNTPGDIHHCFASAWHERK